MAISGPRTGFGELSIPEGLSWTDPQPFMSASIAHFYGLETTMLVCGIELEENTLCNFYVPTGDSCPAKINQSRVLRHMVKVDEDTILMLLTHSVSDPGDTVPMTLIDIEDDVPDCIKEELSQLIAGGHTVHLETK